MNIRLSKRGTKAALSAALVCLFAGALALLSSRAPGNDGKTPARPDPAPAPEPAARPAPDPEPKGDASGFKVAVVQASFPMGEKDSNRFRMARFAGLAAKEGAKIVVFPECAVQGYMAPDGSRVWKAPDFEGDEKEVSLEGHAETVHGHSTSLFCMTAKEFGIYIVLPFIEKAEDSDNYFNSVAVFAPDTSIVAHYRKAVPWTVAEYAWASSGDGEPVCFDTPFGRVGVMICYDVHAMLPLLAEKGAKLVVWPAWWVDDDPQLFFGERLPDLCRRYGVALAAANRAASGSQGELPGAGLSRIVDGAGRAVASAPDEGEHLVVGRLK